MSQTGSANPFRPGSGIFPPLLVGRERETAIFEARIARTREGHPQHTALLGEWAIGKTTLLMHWRRLRQRAGDSVVLSMAHPQTKDDFLDALARAVDSATESEWSTRLDVEVGLDLGIAEARVRRPDRNFETELRRSLRQLVTRRTGGDRTAVVMVDDVDLVAEPGDALLHLRATALELYAADMSLAFVVAGSPRLFAAVRAAHEPLVRFFEPVTLRPLESDAAARGVTEPLGTAGVSFDPGVVAEIVELSGGRPYYLQKLAYYAFDAAKAGRTSRAEFRLAFEEAFASVSQEIFAARWAGMSPVERQVVAILASVAEPRPSGEVESAAIRNNVRPAATRQALRRLAARGHIDRLANGHRGRYAVRDRLFRR